MLLLAVLFLAGFLAGLLAGYVRKKSILVGLAAGAAIGAGVVVLATTPFILVLAIGVILIVAGVLLVK